MAGQRYLTPATTHTTTGNVTAASSVPSATAPDTGFTSRWYCTAKMYALAPVGMAANSTTTPAASGGRSSSFASAKAAAGIASSLSALITTTLNISPLTSNLNKLMPSAISAAGDPACASSSKVRSTTG